MTNKATRTNARFRLLVAGGMATCLAGMATGFGAGAAQADEGGGSSAAYGGFQTQAWASPIRVEMFEPSLPIPVDAGVAQLEFDMGYSKVKADSGEARGRASLFWPGDPVGEGLKSFAEQLGFPANPVTDGGYPMQVNSLYPGDQTTQTDNSIPGSIMTTTSGDGEATAETGFSTDGAVVGPDGATADPGSKNGLMDLLSGVTGLLSGGLGGGGVPGLPSLPGTSSAPVAKAAAPGLPPQLAGLVDVDGYVSSSKMVAKEGKVVGSSRATLGEVRLLGGLITLGGVETVAKTTSDGTTGTATGRTAWGKMTIAGQEFGIGPDGAITGGKNTPVPGLNQVPLDALKALGVSIKVPEQVRKVEGDAGTSVSSALEITIDTALLAPVLQALPTAALGDLIPAEAGPLKGVVSGISNLAPKVVITLGIAKAEVDTVEPIGDVASSDVSEEAPPAADAAPEAAPPAAGAVGVPSAVAPTAMDGATSGAPSAVGDLIDAAPASAGLPELFSIPGMLLVGAFALAAVAGSWFRRLGAAALGIGASCPHGLDSGLPDLRKA